MKTTILLLVSLLYTTLSANTIIFTDQQKIDDRWVIDFRLSSPAELNKAKVTIDDKTVPSNSEFMPSSKISQTALVLIDSSSPMRQAFEQGIKPSLPIIAGDINLTTIAVYTFDANPKPVMDFNTTYRQDALNSITIRGQRTQLYRSAMEAIKILSQRKEDRKYLYIFSDGDSEDTAYSAEDVITAAKKHHITIISFGYRESVRLQSIRRLAEATIGELFIANKRTHQLPDNYIQALQKIHNSGGQLIINAQDIPADESGQKRLTLHLTTTNKAKITNKITKSFTLPTAKSYTKWIVIGTALLIALVAIITGYRQKTVREQQKIKQELADQKKLQQQILKNQSQNKNRDQNSVKPAKKGNPIAYFEVIATGEKLYIYKDYSTIGKQDDNDIIIKGDYISRHHASLNHKDGQFFIVDNHSTNGLYVNGQGVRNEEIRVNDKVAFGNYETRFYTAI